MKYLILSLIVVSTAGHGAQVAKSEIEVLSNKAIAMVKDIEIEKNLENSAEFAKCKAKAKFEDAIDDSERDKQIQLAQTCFNTELSKKTNAEELKKLSESLNLETYGLVQSKNVSDIQKYLSSKMYKSLTGIDPEEKDRQKLIDSMSFNAKNRKLVDQKVFIEIYKAQIIKNSLFEISRFCFEDFRNNIKPDTDFASHWEHTGDIAVAFPKNTLTDSKAKPFGNMNNITKKEDIYSNIFESIQGAKKDVNSFRNFFFFCAEQINDLCSIFEKDTKGGNGANACLTKNRLSEYRKALASSKKVAEEFDSMSEKSVTLVLSGKGDPVFYGKNSNESESIDNLTTYTTNDFLEGGNSDDSALKDKQELCSTKPELSECEEYLSVGDSFDKVNYNYQIKMSLQKEVEKARVKALVAGDKKNLEEYLEANGYFNILKDWKADPANFKLEKAIEDTFEAKKLATLEALKQKMGGRQINQEKAKDVNEVNKLITNNVEVSKNERARLAQIILFNNIVTSYIVLTKKGGKGGKGDSGRNVNAWKKEQEGLKSSDKIDKSLFSNLEGDIKPNDSGLSTKGSNIEDFEALDKLLGKD